MHPDEMTAEAEVPMDLKRMLAARVRHDFSYHAPKGDQVPRYVEIRAEAKELALTIVDLTPIGREQSLALTHLEEAVMWANAAIARNE